MRRRRPKALIVMSAVLFVLPAGQSGASSDCRTNDRSLGNLQEWAQESRNAMLEPVIQRLKARGFVCLNSARDPNSARRCVGKIPGYPKKVAVYIPVKYPIDQTDPTVVTHLQGDAVDASFEGTLARYRLGDELHRSGSDKLLVVPESINKCDTYREHLSTGEQFNAFQNQLKGLFQEVGLFRKDPELRGITRELTGHSRAYLPIGNILRNACGPGVSASSGSPCVQLKQVALFDSIYCGARNRLDSNESAPRGSFNENASCQGLHRFAKDHPPRLRSYYREGSQTDIGTKLILPKRDPKHEAAGGACTGRFPLKPAVHHLSVMNGNFARALAEDFSTACAN
jgi:hypothetical protein